MKDYVLSGYYKDHITFIRGGDQGELIVDWPIGSSIFKSEGSEGFYYKFNRLSIDSVHCKKFCINNKTYSKGSVEKIEGARRGEGGSTFFHLEESILKHSDMGIIPELFDISEEYYNQMVFHCSQEFFKRFLFIESTGKELEFVELLTKSLKN